MKTAQLKIALFIVWAILSIFILFILITPFIWSEETIRAVTSKIKAPHENRCMLCGITTSFIKISKGEFEQSLAATKLGIYFFTIFLVNEFVICYILFRKFKTSLLRNRRFNL